MPPTNRTPRKTKKGKISPKHVRLVRRVTPKKHDIISSDDSDATMSDDSDFEPPGSDEDDDPAFPKHLANMGRDVIISVHVNNHNKWFKKDGNVTELDEDGIKAVDKKDMAIIMFFAEWCPHCQHMKPVFEEVAKTSPIPCYALDCESYPTLSNKYNIEGFPTIMVLKKGLAPPFMVKDDSYIYSEGPNTDSLKKWIDESKTKLLTYTPNKTSKPISKLAHLKGIKQFMGVEQGGLFKGSKVHELDPISLDETIKENKPFLIMFFAPWCGHCIHAKDMYKALAETMDVYALNADEYGETAEKYGVTGFPTFGMMVNGKLQKYIGPRTEDGLMAFSKTASVRDATVINITSLDDLRKMDQVITMFYAPWCGHCTHFKPTFAELAKDHAISFAMVNCDELTDAKSEFGIRGFPTIHKLGMGKILSTFSDSPRTAETVSNWIKHS